MSWFNDFIGRLSLKTKPRPQKLAKFIDRLTSALEGGVVGLGTTSLVELEDDETDDDDSQHEKHAANEGPGVERRRRRTAATTATCNRMYDSTTG